MYFLKTGGRFPAPQAESQRFHADGDKATIRNGKISARVNSSGVVTFYKDGEMILCEYYRNYTGTESRESRCLKIAAREYDPIPGGDYRLTVRFEGRDGEKIYGTGQYQHGYLEQKGCILELAQRNSQKSGTAVR